MRRSKPDAKHESPEVKAERLIRRCIDVVDNYKTLKCKRRDDHDKRACPYWHSTMDFRDDVWKGRTRLYSGSSFNKTQQSYCPEVYNTQPCNKQHTPQGCSFGPYCAFFHEDEVQLPRWPKGEKVSREEWIYSTRCVIYAGFGVSPNKKADVCVPCPPPPRPAWQSVPQPPTPPPPAPPPPPPPAQAQARAPAPAPPPPPPPPPQPKLLPPLTIPAVFTKEIHFDSYSMRAVHTFPQIYNYVLNRHHVKGVSLRLSINSIVLSTFEFIQPALRFSLSTMLVMDAMSNFGEHEHVRVVELDRDSYVKLEKRVEARGQDAFSWSSRGVYVRALPENKVRIRTLKYSNPSVSMDTIVAEVSGCSASH